MGKGGQQPLGLESKVDTECGQLGLTQVIMVSGSEHF